MNHGYNANPEATARAWRNGWFHTGDAFRRDADGNFFFVDRMKDAIRRRGENISSFEVEAEIGAHPGVREAAAVGVPSEFGEDEMMASSRRCRAPSIDPVELIASCAAHAALHGAALRPLHDRSAEDADAEGPETRAARRGDHGGHLGPRARRHPSEAREACRW